MKKSILLVLIDSRKDAAVRVQKVLTGWGCIIKTRLGLHQDVNENCSEHGFLFLELTGDDEQNKELCRKLDILEGVSAKLIEMSLDA